MKIELNYIEAREILDSRGRPTIEVEISAKNPFCNSLDLKAFGISPSGASCGKFEAHELRDNDPNRFLGFGVLNCVQNVKTLIKDLLFSGSIDLTNQFAVDSALINLDKTENKSKLGANTLIASSLAIAKLNAMIRNIPLWKYINNLINSDYFQKIHNSLEIITPKMPDPFVNILNGGLHADNGLSIQEFMIIPHGIHGFKEKIRACSEIFGNLKKIIQKEDYNTNVGDEGGFAPNLDRNQIALEFLSKAVNCTNYSLGNEIIFGLDVAASSFFKNEQYYIDKEYISEEKMIEYLISLCKHFPIGTIEDALNEESYQGWRILTEKIENENLKKEFKINDSKTKILGKNKIRLIGDDLFVTNPKLFTNGIKNSLGNSILIKPNQIGTLSETLNVISLAIKHNYDYIISHRSGETEDTFISHLAVGTGAMGIKTGSVCRSERTAKYNELIRIEETINPR